MPEVRGAHGGVLNRTLLSVNGQRERGVVEQLNKPARRLSCSRNSGPSASQALWIFDDLDEEPERTFRSRLGMDKTPWYRANRDAAPCRSVGTHLPS
jgi:hypothetical protein